MTYKGYVEFEVESQMAAHGIIAAILTVLDSDELHEAAGTLPTEVDAWVSEINVEEKSEPLRNPVFDVRVDGPKNVEELVNHLIKVYDSVRRARS